MRFVWPLLIGGSLAIYSSLAPESYSWMRVEAVSALIASVALVVRWRRNPGALILATVIAYFNYSVLIAYYLLPQAELVPRNTDAVSLESLSIGLRCMLIFMAMLLSIPAPKASQRVKTEADALVWVAGCLFLLYVLFFEIDRTDAGGSYSVRISPLYEYSFIVVAVVLASAKRNRLAVAVVLLLSILIVVQDAYYGGRVTSTQILIAVALTTFSKWIRIRAVALLASLAVIGGTIIGATRAVAQSGVSLSSVLSGLRDGLFVSNTSTFAYYASLTHASSAEVLTDQEKTRLWGSLLRQTFIGGESDYVLSRYISDNYFVNFGGGFFFTTFYALGGFVSVVAACALACWVLDLLFAKGTNNAHAALLIVIVAASSSRWYMYSPTALIRCLILASALVWLCWLWSRVVRGTRGIGSGDRYYGGFSKIGR